MDTGGAVGDGGRQGGEGMGLSSAGPEMPC